MAFHDKLLKNFDDLLSAVQTGNAGEAMRLVGSVRDFAKTPIEADPSIFVLLSTFKNPARVQSFRQKCVAVSESIQNALAVFETKFCCDTESIKTADSNAEAELEEAIRVVRVACKNFV